MREPTKKEMLNLIDMEIKIREEGLEGPDEKVLKKEGAPKWMIDVVIEFKQELEILQAIHCLIEKTTNEEN